VGEGLGGEWWLPSDPERKKVSLGEDNAALGGGRKKRWRVKGEEEISTTEIKSEGKNICVRDASTSR
jgi:hypothetical protein